MIIPLRRWVDLNLWRQIKSRTPNNQELSPNSGETTLVQWLPVTSSTDPRTSRRKLCSWVSKLSHILGLRLEDFRLYTYFIFHLFWELCSTLHDLLMVHTDFYSLLFWYFCFILMFCLLSAVWLHHRRDSFQILRRWHHKTFVHSSWSGGLLRNNNDHE